MRKQIETIDATKKIVTKYFRKLFKGTTQTEVNISMRQLREELGVSMYRLRQAINELMADGKIDMTPCANVTHGTIIKNLKFKQGVVDNIPDTDEEYIAEESQLRDITNLAQLGSLTSDNKINHILNNIDLVRTIVSRFTELVDELENKEVMYIKELGVLRERCSDLENKLNEYKQIDDVLDLVNTELGAVLSCVGKEPLPKDDPKVIKIDSRTSMVV